MYRLAYILVAICFGFAALAQGEVITLLDKNSAAQIDPATPAGLFTWQVDGEDQLSQQWFWYRVGNTAEAPINTISASVSTLPNARTLYVRFANAQFGVEVDYTLTGSSLGSGTSGLA